MSTVEEQALTGRTISCSACNATSARMVELTRLGNAMANARVHHVSSFGSVSQCTTHETFVDAKAAWRKAVAK